MNDASWSAGLPRMNPARAFAAVFVAVFLLMFAISAAVTFSLPESYSAIARVNAPEPGQLELLQSAEVLKRVARELKLPDVLAARYGQSRPLDERRVEDLLRRDVLVRRVRGGGLVEVRVYSRAPAEGAQIANEIVVQAQQDSHSIRLVEKAVPALRPSRPNKPLNLALGVVVGAALGILAGGVGAKLATGFDARPSEGPNAAASLA